MKNSSWLVALRTATLAGAALLIVTSAASAQRGGGGGRGGGRGGMGGGTAPNPMQRVREELKTSNYFEFLDDKGKQIGLEKAQKDSVKGLNKQMESDQKPLFKEIEKYFKDAEREAMVGGGGGGGGARGGGMGEPPGGEAGGGRGRGGAMPELVRTLMQQLVGMQEEYATKAKAVLTDKQKPVADSLNVIYQADLRDRERRRSRG